MQYLVGLGSKRSLLGFCRAYGLSRHGHWQLCAYEDEARSRGRGACGGCWFSCFGI